MPTQATTPLRATALRLVFSALTGSVLLAACGQGAAPPAAPLGAGMPPAQVGVITVNPGDWGLSTELPGRLEASRIAQVRARVAGVVQRQLFSEGSYVQAGQALFEIDASSYKASLDGAQANLAKAEANAMQATAQAERYKPLVAAKAISEQDWVAAQAAQKQAEADIGVARAALQSARINLNYASVTAPIAGTVGRALVTVGALVGQGEATPLALVQQTNPMFINFTQSAGEVMKLRKALESGQLKRASGSQAASVRLVLEDGTEYPLAGRLLFSDLTVDASTGQITLRAEIPNPQGVLLPGLYVRVRLEQALASNAFALPQQAVTRTPQGDTVMVVDAQGKVAPRTIKIGGQRANQWIVTSGLQAGDQVMVDGFQKLRGDAPVKAVPWVPPGSVSAPSPGTGASAASAPTASAASR